MTSITFPAHVLAVALVASTLGCAFADSAEPHKRSQTTWGWFRANSTGGKWWVTTGVARVTVEGKAISADLHDADDPDFIRVSLSGTISNRDVEVHATVHATDMPDFALRGRLQRLCWESGGGREVLVLSNGVAVIALTRELANESCEPTA